jgi:hypothetical protein
MAQKMGKVGCGTAVVFGVVALCLLPAACSALSDAPDMRIPPHVVHHDTVIVVPQPAVTVTKRVAPTVKPTSPKAPTAKAPAPAPKSGGSVKLTKR